MDDLIRGPLPGDAASKFGDGDEASEQGPDPSKHGEDLDGNETQASAQDLSGSEAKAMPEWLKENYLAAAEAKQAEPERARRIQEEYPAAMEPEEYQANMDMLSGLLRPYPLSMYDDELRQKYHDYKSDWIRRYNTRCDSIAAERKPHPYRVHDYEMQLVPRDSKDTTRALVDLVRSLSNVNVSFRRQLGDMLYKDVTIKLRMPTFKGVAFRTFSMRDQQSSEN